MIPKLLFHPAPPLADSDPAVLLRDQVKTAVAFEHAIIPLYLYSLYSLDPERNPEIAALLRSIVRDEMLHMLLACNLLNALGGAPNLESPDFVPPYPSQLPGTIALSMKVGLAPFSLELVESVFMEIERPDDPLRFPTESLAFDGGVTYRTVGQFYRGILAQIEKGGNALIVGSPLRQVTDPRMPELIAIFDADGACHAIRTIVEQGEGTVTKPTHPGGDYAHYYKFEEMVKHRQLVPNLDAGPDTPANQRYRYGGAAIPFKPDGVWRVPADPRASRYAGKSLRACQKFNYTYTSLLRTLHTVVNGRPQDLPSSLGMMHSLREQAMAMMSGSSTDGVATGPTFEYQPVMPP